MNNIISVNVRIEQDQMITDSRNVADVFQKQHKHVLDSIRNIEKDVPNFRQMFFETTLPDSYGREQKVFFMNRDGFTLLAMGFTGQDAMIWKLKYIEAFNLLEKAWNTPEQVMARALRLADQTISKLNQRVIEMKPKADFFDAVADSKTAISMNEVAKVLAIKGYGRNNLFEFLRNEYVLDKFNVPYQRYVDRGWFRVIEQKYMKNGEPVVSTKTLVYQKGVDAIRKKLMDYLEKVG